MRILIHGFFIVLLIGGWTLFIVKKDAGETVLTPQERAEMVDRGEDIRAAQAKRATGGESVVNGMLMAFLSAGYIGVVFVVYVLPTLAHKFTHSVYDSGEMVEKDVMHDARARYAQGDYEGAIEAYRDAAKADSTTRLPWVEIVKIQRENLEDPDAAIATLRHALENYAWAENDAGYFLFRLAELYDTDKQDRAAATGILEQVVEQFPETRHFANAKHKLREWGQGA